MDPYGKTVIITGASSGIGAATARVFASSGARLVLAARNAAALEQLARELPGSPLAVPTDVTDRGAVEALVAAAFAKWGSVDMLINNAGIGLSAPVAQIAAADFERVFAANLLGPLFAIQAVLPHMQAAGRGQIINVSSVAAARSLPYGGGYAASKAALDRLSEALRTELLGSGVVVTTVRPGTTSTPFREHRLGGGRDQRALKGRGVPPTAVARAILRAARREPLVAYVTLADRVTLLVAALLPGLTDRLLARTFRWQE